MEMLHGHGVQLKIGKVDNKVLYYIKGKKSKRIFINLNLKKINSFFIF